MSPTIDKTALLAKYRQERDKRLRPDGNDQYLQVTGRLAHYLDDPYTPRRDRAPKTDHVRFAFIGGGFAGLSTAMSLAERGHTDIVLLEAERIGHGASGRNGGFVFGGFSLGERPGSTVSPVPEGVNTLWELTTNPLLKSISFPSDYTD